MGLGSVLQVAMTGVAAAESIVAAISNNLANSRTPGYKASSVQLVSQAPQTQGNGSAATGGNGGTNPVQVGMGVAVGATTLDFSQGQVVLDDNPLGMCMEGPGLFILRGRQGERSYTRDGRFSLNSDHELVNVDGHQVLGFSADADFQVQRGKLVPLRIPLGRTFATSGGGAPRCSGSPSSATAASRDASATATGALWARSALRVSPTLPASPSAAVISIPRDRTPASPLKPIRTPKAPERCSLVQPRCQTPTSVKASSISSRRRSSSRPTRRWSRRASICSMSCSTCAASRASPTPKHPPRTRSRPGSPEPPAEPPRPLPG